MQFKAKKIPNLSSKLKESTIAIGGAGWDATFLGESESLRDIKPQTRKETRRVVEVAKAGKIISHCLFDWIAAGCWWCVGIVQIRRTRYQLTRACLFLCLYQAHHTHHQNHHCHRPQHLDQTHFPLSLRTMEALW